MNPLGPFAMRTPLACPDYYGPSAPPSGHRRTTRQPAPARPDGRQGTGATRWFPRSPWTDRWVRWPALPQRHRHGYAADLHRGLPAGFPDPARGVARPIGSGVRRDPARISRIWAGASSWGAL